MPETHQKNSDAASSSFSPRHWNALLLSLAVIMATLLALILADKHLYADGAHYLRSVLDSGAIQHVGLSRGFANDITQWPLALAIHFGARDISFLSHVYGLSIIYIYPLTFLLCAVAVRGERPLLLIFPLLSMAGINLAASAVLFGESQVMPLLAWPILFLAIRRTPLRVIDIALLWSLLLLFTRVYETSLAVSLLLAIIFIARLIQTGRLEPALRWRSRLTWSVALGLSLIAIAIAGYFILFPRDAANRGSFISSLSRMIGNPKGQCLLAVSSFLSLGLLSARRIYGALALGSIGIFCIALIQGNHYSSMVDSFEARNLTLLLPLLMLWALLIAWRSPPARTWASAILCLYITVASLSEAATLTKWKGYLDDFRTALNSHQGFLSLKESGLEGGYGFWFWTMPTMSLLLQGQCVHTVVLNDPAVSWQPFDPRQQLMLKNYVSYGPQLQAIDPTARRCS
jgi:hypothetical protein